MAGLRIAFLGVDGIGKTSLTRVLGTWFEQQGLDHETVSWRRIANGSVTVPTYPSTCAKQMWVEDWRLLYGGGAVDDVLVDDSIPLSHVEFDRLDVEETFPLTARGVRSSGPMASGLVEMAMDYVFEAEVVRPRAAAGTTVMRETFGFKPVLKSLLIARACAPGSVPTRSIDRAIDRVVETYSDEYLQPDVGIYLDGDLELALSRRSREGRGVGVGEDYGLAGRTGSYLELQQHCQGFFREAAQEWGWYHLDIGDRTPGELGDEVIGSLLRDATQATV